MKMQFYRDLDAWKYAMELASSTYKSSTYKWSRRLPREHRFELTSQILRSALSVPCNIAEGYGRRNRGEYLQFLGIARGSLREMETCLLLVKQAEIADDMEPILDPGDRVGKILYGLEKSLTQQA